MAPANQQKLGAWPGVVLQQITSPCNRLNYLFLLFYSLQQTRPRNNVSHQRW